MSWLETLPTPHVVSDSRFYDRQSKQGNNKITQVQKRRVQVVEYRGVSSALADSTAVPTVSSNGTKSYELHAIEGGGYNIIETRDYIISDWIDLVPGEDPITW